MAEAPDPMHSPNKSERALISGRVTTGIGEGARFTQLPWIRKAFVALLDIDPFPGTLNLKIEETDVMRQWHELKARSGSVLLPPPDTEFCRARCYPVLVEGRLRAAIVCPEVRDYPKDQIELIAAVSIRKTLSLKDGDRLSLEVDEPN